MSEAMRVEVVGERLECKHCGAIVFFQEETPVDRLGLAGPSVSWGHHATIYVCASCGFLHWFFALDLGRSERSDRDESDDGVECLSCGHSIPAGASACPGCGWSWESAGPGPLRSGSRRLEAQEVEDLDVSELGADAPNSTIESRLSLSDRLEMVHDRGSFIAFVEAMAAEREEAERMERNEPDRYQFAGALGWENGTISAFLDATLAYFEATPLRQPESMPSWKMFAEFLYYGKIYE